MVQGHSKSPFINKKSRTPRPTLDRGAVAFVPGGSKVDRWIRDRGWGGEGLAERTETCQRQ